jgi:protease I
MLIAKHNEELEVHVPYYAFSALGFEVHVASPYKSKGTCIDMAIFDFEDEEGERNYQLKLGHPFKTTLDFNAIGVEDYDGLYIPGGDSYVEFCESKETLEMVRYFLGAKKPLGAVCTGLQVLLAAGGLDGAKVTGFKREGMAEMVK